MDMRGQQHIAADREMVWQALNDPDVLKVCIPGCQELNKTSDTEMTAVAVVRVGPVSARFQGVVTLSDLDPPNGYRITGEGQGGVAGFARGTASVRLEAVEGGTVLHYEVDAQIGGKLSQLGGRLIDATARKMSGAFFERFGQEILARKQQPVLTSRDPGLRVELDSTASEGKVSSSSGPQPDTGRRGAFRQAKESASRTSSFLELIAAALLGGIVAIFWFRYGGLFSGFAATNDAVAGEGIALVSPGFAAAVQLIMAAAIGYLFGARNSHRS